MGKSIFQQESVEPRVSNWNVIILEVVVPGDLPVHLPDLSRRLGKLLIVFNIVFFEESRGMGELFRDARAITFDAYKNQSMENFNRNLVQAIFRSVDARKVFLLGSAISDPSNWYVQP